MKRHLACIAVLAALTTSGVKGEESSWIFRPSYFSHTPETGQRVVQYQPEEPVIVRCDPTYQESGFSYSHSSVQVGQNEDHLHIVQTWGRGDAIRPYGEWEYPYRAGATPYGPWTNSQGAWGYPQGPWGLRPNPWQNPYGPGPSPRTPWASWGGQQASGFMAPPGPALPGPSAWAPPPARSL